MTEPAGRWRSWWAALGLARLLGVALRPATVVALGLLAGALVPLGWLTSTPSFCPFKVTTGLPCPGCGLTRSAVALLHGDLSTSVFFHPLGGPLLAAMLAVALIDAWVWFRRRGQPGGAPGPSWLLDRLARTPAPWVAIGALAVVWLVRLPLYVGGVWVF